jgi:hypothetical protein
LPSSETLVVITSTICIIALIIALVIALKVCRTELSEFTAFFHGIITSGLKELRFEGGRAAKANIILSGILALLFISVFVTDVLRDIREFIDGAAPQRGSEYILLAALVLFFLVSLCFVFATDRYSQKMRDEKNKVSVKLS